MNTAPFKRVAELYLQIKELETKYEAARQEAEAELLASGNDKVESDYGSFFFSERKKWTYTDAVDQQEGLLKNLKRAEEESGKATCDVQKTFTFRGVRG